MNKRDWVKPELVILTRNKPQEAVLQNCKGIGSGANQNNNSCLYDSGSYSDCDPCNNISRS